MERLIATLFLTLIQILPLLSASSFQQGSIYHIVCQQFPNGCVTDGVSAGQTTPLFYLENYTTGDETFWEISEVRSGLYSIKNSKTGKFVAYDGVRSDSPVRRYVTMTSSVSNTQALWTIEWQGGNNYTIRNAAQTEHIWDVRSPSTGTPFVVGTYARPSGYATNQLFSFVDKNGQNVTENFTIQSPISQAIDNLTIGQQGPLYIGDQDYYLCPTPLENFGGNMTASINYSAHDGWETLLIDGTPVPAGSNYTFKNVSAGKNYTLSIVNKEGQSISTPLTFTSLPVASMQGSFGYDYAEGFLCVQEPDQPSREQDYIKAKWRGGITNGYDKNKRNYHIQFIDTYGQKIDRKLFGLRNDNSWILEACQVDMSRVRNRVLTDLWNDFSIKPYYVDREPKALTGTRGRFVELILNGEYRGIYCMTEAIDRKQMKLKKYDENSKAIHGQLWKSKDWSYAVFMGHDRDKNSYPRTSPVSFNNNSESWDQYDVKYPDFDDVKPTDWSTLWNAVNFVCTSSDEDFRNHIADYFDLPLVIDYYILMETILSSDNHGKNMYFAVYDKEEDKRITFGVWDMDATTGQRWSDSYYHSTIMRPEQDYANYITQNEHGDFNLFRRLRLTNANNFNMQVRLRYRDLRQGYLQTESILDRFRQQLAEFKSCGASEREKHKWSGDTDINKLQLNFDDELAYIEDWVTRRMNYLDKTRFNIAELPDVSIDSQYTNNYAPTVTGIYTLSGQCISKESSEQKLHSLPPGIYLVNGHKVAVGR